jgi:hypothetical protein
MIYMKRCVLLLLILTACSAPVSTKKVETPPPPAILEVTFGISAPFSHSKVLIDSQGKLTYNAEVYPPAVSKPTHETKTVQLTEKQLEALHKLLAGSNLFEMGDRHVPGQDCVSHGVSYKTVQGVKSFGCSCGCPDEMNTVEAKINELLGQPMVIMGF